MGRSPATDFAGHRFGRFTVVRWEPVDDRRSAWLCACECGQIRHLHTRDIRAELIKSCGCYKSDRASKLTKTHGKSRIGLAEYKVWASIKDRCYNENDQHFPNYGGRGIEVSPRWRVDFEAFLADVGPRPSLKHSIDRINNDGNYEPGNVRWSTPKEQARNRRTNVLVDVDGILMPIAAAAEIVGLCRKLIAKRINNGWPVQRALRTPVDMRFSHVQHP